MTNHSMCPHCDASWGIEEMSFQECDSCGYPNPDTEENKDNENDMEDFFDEGPACRKCGCTQYHACPGGCFWVEKDLCNKCVNK